MRVRRDPIGHACDGGQQRATASPWETAEQGRSIRRSQAPQDGQWAEGMAEPNSWREPYPAVIWHPRSDDSPCFRPTTETAMVRSAAEVRGSDVHAHRRRPRAAPMEFSATRVGHTREGSRPLDQAKAPCALPRIGERQLGADCVYPPHAPSSPATRERGSRGGRGRMDLTDRLLQTVPGRDLVRAQVQPADDLAGVTEGAAGRCRLPALRGSGRRLRDGM